MKKIIIMLFALSLFSFVSCKQEVEVSIPEDGLAYWTHDDENAYVLVVGYETTNATEEKVLVIGYLKIQYEEGETNEYLYKKGKRELCLIGQADRSGNTFNTEELKKINPGSQGRTGTTEPVTGSLSITLKDNGNSADYKYTDGENTEDKNDLEKFQLPSLK